MGSCNMKFFRVINYQFNHEIIVLDAKTTLRELLKETVINFFYGFLGNTTTVAILSKNPYIMSLSFFLFYSFLSIVINRNKYETKLGKHFIMPISAAAGALIGCIMAFKYFHI